MLALIVMLALVGATLLPGLVMVGRSPEGFFPYCRNEDNDA